MEKRFSNIVGVSMILLGALALLVNLALPSVGINFWDWTVGRFWPLIIIGVGWIFVLIPLLVRGRRGLGGFFIVGLPILATGGILFLTNFFGWWDMWEFLWPLEVLSLALGFLFAALTMRVTWLVIPAIITGMNGLVFLFCAITGLWEMWAVLWTVEPLAVGLALIVVSLIKQSNGLFVAGLILCGVAGVGFLLMSGILVATVAWPWLWLFKLAVPAILIFTGALVLGWNLLRRPSTTNFI
jgi:hypothetical protein